MQKNPWRWQPNKSVIGIMWTERSSGFFLEVDEKQRKKKSLQPQTK